MNFGYFLGQRFQGNPRKNDCKNEASSVWWIYFFNWLINAHWLLDTQITFQECRMYFCPFFRTFLQKLCLPEICNQNSKAILYIGNSWTKVSLGCKRTGIRGDQRLSPDEWRALALRTISTENWSPGWKVAGEEDYHISLLRFCFDRKSLISDQMVNFTRGLQF